MLEDSRRSLTEGIFCWPRWRCEGGNKGRPRWPEAFGSPASPLHSCYGMLKGAITKKLCMYGCRNVGMNRFFFFFFPHPEQSQPGIGCRMGFGFQVPASAHSQRGAPKVPGIWGILGPPEAAPHCSGSVLGAGARFPAAGTRGGQEGSLKPPD